MHPQIQSSRQPRLTIGICMLLTLLVCAVFGQTFHYGYVNYDDGDYVYENPHVLKGLTGNGIRWAFTHSHSSNWHPLTTLSHMLDCQLSRDPGWYHVTNVLLHAAAAVLLLIVLWEMTGGFWISVFVAAVFAIHPLRVESVAWISERKDVLSGLFFMLTLGAYVRYARNPGWQRYAVAMIFAAFGMMSKPTLVTLPFVLLLLDYWPLNRSPLPVRLIIEKIPLFALSAACCIATVWAQKGAVESIQPASLWTRTANALVSFAIYIGEMFYPAGLAVLYPRPENGVPAWQVVFAVILLTAISITAIAWRKKRPYILVGWLWYLGMLVPMSGVFMQVGVQSHADRYTYLPQIGLYLIIACAAAEFYGDVRSRRMIFGVAGCTAVGALAFAAWNQTSYWRDSGTLWRRDLAVTSRNAVAHNNYGFYLFQNERADEAISEYRQALEIRPQYVDAHSNLAIALETTGHDDEALEHYQTALAIHPNFPEVETNVAHIYYEKGDYAQALAHCEKALELKPDYPEAHYVMGMALAARGDAEGAVSQFQKALDLATAQSRDDLVGTLRREMQFHRARHSPGQPVE